MPEVIMPKMGDAMESGTLLAWRKKSGDSVAAGDVIAEIETDKSNVELEAEDSGVLQTKVAEGASVPVGGVIATIGEASANGQSKGEEAKPAAAAAQTGNGQKAAAPSTGSASAPAPASAQPAASRPAQPVAAAPAQQGTRVIASPLAKRIARENSVDIAQVKGTGPNGRIIEADIKGFLAQGPAKAGAAIGAQPAQSPAPGEARELSQIRRVIAKRMAESKGPIPHFYVTSEVDMAEAMALREKLNSYDESLAKISLNDIVVKAAALALKKFPAVNSVYQNDKIVTFGAAHVGIAVALDDGLIVPVVRNADTLPLRKVAEAAKGLIAKARDKKLQPGEYQGGTFTVSNLGGFDVENFIAIIDPSQGGILAVSTIVKKPVVLDDDTIVVRPRMNITLSGDHRVIDGATGAKFLQEVKKLLQNPLSLLEG